MTFSQDWDNVYRQGKHQSIWPWSDLVSFVMRHSSPVGKKLRVLELGCGAGANIRFFQYYGADYHAIEGSPHIVVNLKKAYSEYSANIVAGDFTAGLVFDGPFDLIVDRAAVTHNSTEAIARTLSAAHERLAVGGKYIGIDWFSTEHSDFAKGKPSGDANTRSGYVDGQFAGVGLVHFSDRKHLEQLFSVFQIEALEHKAIRREMPSDRGLCCAWNIAAAKL